METKANYVRVGIFTLVVLVMSFAFVYWAVFATSGSSRVPLLVRIEGSVTGLQQGSQVLFNGLPVGNVRSLRIDSNNPNVVIAMTEVDPSIPIKESTQANIGFAGLTGQAFISLQGGSAAEENIIQEAFEQGTTPIIRANPSDVTDILATARDISERANNILAQFESLVGTVGPTVETTAANVANISENIEQFTDSLAANSDDIDNFLASLGQLARTANRVAEGLPDAIDRVESLLAAIDPQAVDTVFQNAAAVSENLRTQSENLGSVVDSIRTAANSVGEVGEIVSRNTPAINSFLSSLAPLTERATSVAEQLDTTLQTANRLVAAVDPETVSSSVNYLNSTLANVAAFSESLGLYQQQIAEAVNGAASAAQNAADITSTIANRREEVDSLLANLGPISENINAVTSNVSEATAGLGATMERARRIVAAVDPEEVSTTVEGLSSAATNVSALTQALGQNRERIDTAIAGAASAVQNINQITQAIAERSGDIDRALASISPITENVRQTSEELRQAAQQAQELVASVDRSTINRALGNIEAVTSAVGSKTGEIESIIDGVNDTVATLEQTLLGFNQTRGQVDVLLRAIEPERINTAVTNVSRATDNVAQAADSIAGVANTVGDRREDIDAIITNVQTTTEQFAAVSRRLDGVVNSIDNVLASANGFLGGADDGTGLGADLATTLRSIRAAAEAIQAQVEPLSASLQDTSRQGLQEFRDLARALTQAVTRIQGAITDFSDNPSQLIYGGDDVKTYDGRVRR